MPDSPFFERGSGHFSLFSFLFIFILSITAAAHDADRSFHQTIYSQYPFQKVELIGRRHGVGLYRGQTIKLSPWIEVGPNAYVGISEDRKLFQVLQLENRVVGFLLSGDIEIKDLFLYGNNELFAIDYSGEIYKFAWDQWNVSNLPQLLRRTAKLAVAGIGAAAVATTLTAKLVDVPLPADVLALEFGLLSVSLVGNMAFFSSVQFERENENTNGLVPTGSKVLNFKTSEIVRDQTGQIVDYDLISRDGSVSLVSIVGDQLNINDSAAKGFEIGCEHLLLARGIPPENYEPIQ